MPGSEPNFEYDVHNHGKVKLLAHMGSDKDIVDAARVSYDPSSTTWHSDDRGLIRYLMRHSHTSPFEMVELKFYLKMPIFVARQWIRHRTASLNEASGRYSIMKNEFYVPKSFHYQSGTNKQGSADAMDSGELIERYIYGAQEDFYLYDDLINRKVSREEARIGLPLSTYTELVWKIDLHNLFHFLLLRTDSHAQYQIREYAEVIEEIVSFVVPYAYKAWVEYKKNGANISATVLRVIRELVNRNPAAVRTLMDEHGTGLWSKGETLEVLSLLFGPTNWQAGIDKEALKENFDPDSSPEKTNFSDMKGVDPWQK